MLVKFKTLKVQSSGNRTYQNSPLNELLVQMLGIWDGLRYLRGGVGAESSD